MRLQHAILPFVSAALLGGAALAITACGPRSRGALTPAGYESQNPAYRVAKTGESFLDDGWMLDNYYTNARGNLAPKDEGIYRTTFLFDRAGSGKFEDKIEGLTYDLRFQHKKHAAFICLRTIPLSNELRDKDLRVLMKDYVDGIAGAGYEAVQLSGANAVIEKRYAAEVVEQSDAKLAEKDAFYAVIDVANIDQIKLTPSTRHVRVELVFTRPGTDCTFGFRGGVMSLPAVLMAGYANYPEDFAADEPAFRAFLSEVEIAGRRGFAQATPATPPPPPSPPASAAPAGSAAPAP